MRELAANVSKQLIASKELDVIGEPELKEWKAEKDEPVELTLEMEVQPKVAVKDYEGLEVEIEEGGIDLLNNPTRMLYYVEVSKEVAIEVEGMDFAYTGRGAMLRINLTAIFLQNTFIGPGSNLIHVSKMPSGRINVTTVVFA